jgi:hypothetical protein
VKHRTLPDFWKHYNALPDHVRALADEQFARLKADSRHPSLHLKRIGQLWSVRVGLHYRALGLDKPGAVIWFWIGTRAEYDRLIERH